MYTRLPCFIPLETLLASKLYAIIAKSIGRFDGISVLEMYVQVFLEANANSDKSRGSPSVP